MYLDQIVEEPETESILAKSIANVDNAAEIKSEEKPQNSSWWSSILFYCTYYF